MCKFLMHHNSQDKVAKKEAIKSEITTSLRSFYCELCDKQYQNVTQYNEHIRSYAHTHKQVSLMDQAVVLSLSPLILHSVSRRWKRHNGLRIIQRLARKNGNAKKKSSSD